MSNFGYLGPPILRVGWVSEGGWGGREKGGVGKGVARTDLHNIEICMGSENDSLFSYVYICGSLGYLKKINHSAHLDNMLLLWIVGLDHIILNCMEL